MRARNRAAISVFAGLGVAVVIPALIAGLTHGFRDSPVLNERRHDPAFTGSRCCQHVSGQGTPGLGRLAAYAVTNLSFYAAAVWILIGVPERSGWWRWPSRLVRPRERPLAGGHESGTPA